MKKSLTIIILVLLALGAWYAYSQYKNPEAYETSQMPTMQDQNMVSENHTQAGSFTGTKEVDASSSTVNWTAKKSVVKDWVDTGTVSFTEGEMTFNNGALVSGNATVDMKSIKVATTGMGGGQDKLQGHVKSADFFDVEKYPTAMIKVRSVANGMATGDITIKDITKEITFPVVVTEVNGAYTVSGKATIDRTAFGVKFGSTSFFKDLADKAIIDNNFVIDFKLVTQ